MTMSRREGSLEAPTRHAIDWRSPDFYDEAQLFDELERVFDICHGCRRCFSLCNAFPTLFDAVDEGATGELDGVERTVYWDVVDQCYLCDMCYMSKCPYVPPHEWNVDFPHLMLRAKAQKFREDGATLADRVLASTDMVGKLAGIPVVAEVVNAINQTKTGRVMLEAGLGVDRRAPVPKYHSKPARRRLAHRTGPEQLPKSVNGTQGRVVLFATCYGNRNAPEICEDLVRVLEHNGCAVELAASEVCCGMPKLELGDLDSVQRAKERNVPGLLERVKAGWDIVAPVPSCVLMFKQELPLLFPDDDDVAAVANAFFDPFEYLMLRHKGGALITEFENSLGRVAYHVPCHLRVQNIGLKTKEVLELVPETEVLAIERCSGHDGTYGVKRRFRDAAEKIAGPVIKKAEKAGADYLASDCPMAGEQIALGREHLIHTHPMTLLRRAYGL